MTVTDDGPNLDTSVALGAAAQPGSVQGLLGTASGNPADDFQLPDGTVLQQPFSGQELYGTFANAWSVTATELLLDGAGAGSDGAGSGADATVAPEALGVLGGDAMQFFHASGGAAQDVVQVNASGQVLSAAAGANVLSDAGGFGAVFEGTLAEFANTLLAGVSAKDLIDITGLNSANVTTSYAGSGNAGVLYVSDGAQSGEIYLSGQAHGGGVPHDVRRAWRFADLTYMNGRNRTCAFASQPGLTGQTRS